MIADTDLWAYQLLCSPPCQHSIFLPHQSLLGTFRNQEYLPRMRGPQTFYASNASECSPIRAPCPIAEFPR